MSSSTRERTIEAIRRGQPPRVLIIGGGINGIATFRELALNGVPTLLIDRGDFVSGASAASSHMVHGGIRYLENGEFSLVKESVVERNRLVRNAPHRVKPLATTIPLDHTFAGILAAPLRFLTHKQRTPKARGAALVKAGLMIYDTFAGRGAVVPKHRFHGRKKSLEALPRLRSDVKYTATYYDAAMESPERLALDVLSDGLEAGPHAQAVNYLEAVGLSDDGSVQLRDSLTGETFAVRAEVVVNASGPWTDLTNEALGERSRFMGGTKGSHIVVDHPELLAACAGREIFFENGDGRIVLVYPVAGRVLIGTTDLRVDIANDEITCTEEEIDYFFELTARVFPDIAVDRSHIVYSFSGVRPLPRTEDAAPGFVSRDYRIERRSVGAADTAVRFLSLVGGKWTTFRALGERLSDAVLGELGAPRKVGTSDLTIGGGAFYPSGPRERTQWLDRHLAAVSRERAEVLLERYGTRAVEVVAAIGGRDATEAEIGAGVALTRAEVEWMIENENACLPADVLLRRTDLAFRGEVTPQVVDALVDIFGSIHAWTDSEREAQKDAVLGVLSAARARLRQGAEVAAG